VRVEADGKLTVVAGGSGSLTPQDNVPATSVYLGLPSAIGFDRGGNLLISDTGWNLVRRVDTSTGLIRTIVGTLSVLDGGPALNAPLAFPIGIALHPSGLLVADTSHYRIRRIDAAGTITTIAGTGRLDPSPDGLPATSSNIVRPVGVSSDSRGNIYIVE